VNDIDNAISRLEKQRSAIDRALLALREISDPNIPKAQTGSQRKSRRRRLSPEGRRRIIEATKRRWAAKKTGGTGTAPKSAAAPSRSRRGKLSDDGRKRLALAMKKRWATAKKAGKQRLA
jgi:hypothetical protein